jgi:hypothetical protein
MFQMAYFYLRDGKHNFKTVVIDNVTNLQKLMLNYISDKEANWDPSKDKDMPTRRDYGSLSQYMQRWLIAFRNLPMNVIFIAQETSKDDDDIDSNEPTVFPQVTSSVRGILGGCVDFVGHTYVTEKEEVVNEKTVKRTKFCMHLRPNSKYQCKIRLPINCPKEAPVAIINPQFGSIVKIMKGEF